MANATISTGYYHFLFIELADKRTSDWFLLKDPFAGLALIFGYLYFVLNLGPKLMANRKPFDLRTTLIVYNAIQVVISVYIFYMGLITAWGTRYSWRCQPVDFTLSEQGLQDARLVYMYFLAKLTELLDTVFFVLRKKNNQITFLHVYHHTVMPMISWGCSKYYPGGHGTFIGFINCFVHIIMYSYYLLAALGPSLQKYLWWKKYITTLQLLQFCIAFLHSMQLLFIDCGYPRWSTVFTLPNAIFFYYLFNDFYNKAYTTSSKSSAASKQRVAVTTTPSSPPTSPVIQEKSSSNGTACGNFVNNHMNNENNDDKKRQ